MVADVAGKSVLMTRYFRALEPPHELLDSSDTKLSAENVAWFVSLIPYLPSNAIFPGIQVPKFMPILISDFSYYYLIDPM